MIASAIEITFVTGGRFGFQIGGEGVDVIMLAMNAVKNAGALQPEAVRH